MATSIKSELKKLDAKHQRERGKIMNKCKHNWRENGYVSDKSGTQYYKCSICGAEKGEGF